jgi:pimeloyl-ACP methyl ester carboxylesterase
LDHKEQHADVLNKLMLKLGYDEYVTQGGDWGWFITRSMSRQFPQHVKAQHLNTSIGRPPSLFKHPLLAIESTLKPWTQRERQGLARMQWFDKEGSAYNQVHATKPQTVGYGLSDSPVALLAWIYEKLHDWTDAEICTWISIYWFSTAGPAASVRLYYEFKHSHHGPGNAWDKLLEWQNVKVGIGHFPGDVVAPPNAWTRTVGKIVYEKDHPSGGHFAAWEKPEAILEDLRAMFGKNGGARGVINGSKL